MITYKEALEKARGIIGSIDYCEEYETAYVFGIDCAESDGGFNSPVAISKETGGVINVVEFMTSSPGEILRTVDI